MQQFEVILKNEKTKQYNWFAIFLIVINGVGICLFLLKENYQKLTENPMGFPVIISSACLIISILIFPRFKKGDYPIYFISVAIISYWVILKQWWIAIAMLFMLLLYYVSKKKLKVIIDSSDILYPSFPVKKFKWNKLNNIILKDGLLTIDLKSNKIIQQFIDEKNKAVDENEFNDFCRQQLSK